MRNMSGSLGGNLGLHQIVAVHCEQVAGPVAVGDGGDGAQNC